MVISCMEIAIVGPVLEHCYGTAGFLSLYLVSTVLSSLFYLLFSYVLYGLSLCDLVCAGGLSVLFQSLIVLQTTYWTHHYTYRHLTFSTRLLPYLFIPVNGLVSGSFLYSGLGVLVGMIVKGKFCTILLPSYRGIEVCSKWRAVAALQRYGVWLPPEAHCSAHDCLHGSQSPSYSLAPNST